MHGGAASRCSPNPSDSDIKKIDAIFAEHGAIRMLDTARSSSLMNPHAAGCQVNVDESKREEDSAHTGPGELSPGSQHFEETLFDLP